MLKTSAAVSLLLAANAAPLKPNQSTFYTHGESCGSNNDCNRNWFSKQCCEGMGPEGNCYVWCSHGNVSQQSQTSSNSVMQGYEFGSTDSQSQCVATSFEATEITQIENQILSAFRYGNAQAIYSSYQSIVTVASKFADAEKNCESFWEKFWDETKVVVNDVVKVASYICQYSKPVIAGTAAVGIEEAVPVETAIAGVACATKYFDEAVAVMKAIDDGVDCVELAFGVKQFVNYFDQQGQFNYEIGKFAGEVYRYGKACVHFPEDVIAAAKGAASLMGSEEPVLNQEGSQKRQLVESTPAASTPVTKPPSLSTKNQCQFCLSEAEFISFFQGIYDGQRYLDRSMPELYVQECIVQTDSLKDLFTGQLQSKLTGLMLASQFKNNQESLNMVFELDELTYSVLGNSKCKDLDSLAVFKLMDGKHPIEHNDQSIFFNTTEDVKIELSSIPEMIAFNNQKMINLQSTNSTEDKTQYLEMMGQQLGMATKLYQVKGKDLPAAAKQNDWDTTLLIVGAGAILFSAIVVCVVRMRKAKKVNKDTLTFEGQESINGHESMVSGQE